MIGIHLDWKDLKGRTLGEKIDAVMDVLSPLLKGEKITFTYVHSQGIAGDEGEQGS